MKWNTYKYYLDGRDSYIGLSERECEELRIYEFPLIQVPGILYIREGYRAAGDDIILTSRELRTVLANSLKQSFN